MIKPNQVKEISVVVDAMLKNWGYKLVEVQPVHHMRKNEIKSMGSRILIIPAGAELSFRYCNPLREVEQ